MYRKLRVLKREIKVAFVFLFIFSHSYFISFAQENPNELEYTGTLEGGIKDGIGYKKLTENVTFTQGQTIIYCDSAFFYDETNSMIAFGHVRIEDQEDSVTITSDRLNYNGNGKVAELRGNVVYMDDSIELYTNNLDYDMANKSAVYFNGGKIIDGINTLQSINGNYDTEGKMMIFNDSVSMITPDYTLESENLVYNMMTKRARIRGEQKITTSDGKILRSSQGGEFDTRDNTYAFHIGEVDTEKYFLKGDELYFDNQLGSYTAKGHVYLLAKEDDIVITGNDAQFWQDQGIAKIYGDPLLKKVLNDDTLFLRADTLVSINDSLETNKRLLAYNNVVLFKNDIQGKSDSLVYYLSDSSMAFFKDPILWNAGSQITADTIRTIVKNGTIDQMKTSTNSFIISEDSTENYNQIKGRQMTAFFNGKSIQNVDVTGNGESIYFVSDEENTNATIGMNQIICSNMQIIFLENQVNDIRFYSNPDGKFTPPHELKDDDKKLEGFAWRVDERPSKTEILKDPSEVARMHEEVDEMIKEEEEEKTKLEKLMEERIDIDKIKDQLKKPVEAPKQR